MSLMSLMKGVAIGAGLMYFLDPNQGKRRQQDVMGNINRFTNEKQRALDAMQRDFANRSRGFVSEIKGRVHAEDPSDSLLEQRVRSAIGKVVSNAGAMIVIAEKGIVTFAGKVKDGELDELISVAHQVPGVKEVRHELETTEGEPETVLSIPRLNPAESLVAVGAGTFLVASGFLRGGMLGPIFKIGGVLLAAKGFSDTEQRFQTHFSSAPAAPAPQPKTPRKRKSQASVQ